MIIELPESLRIWLSKEMAPICDADPCALAKYVLALLKKDKTDVELKEFCIEQLDVFLHSRAAPFVEKLFGVLRDRSYVEKGDDRNLAAPLSNTLRICGSTMNESKYGEETKERNEEERRRSNNMPDKQKSRDREFKKSPESVDTTSAQRTFTRKRISPPNVTPDLRRGNERRRTRSPRDRRNERGQDRRVQSLLRAPHRMMDRHKGERNDRMERKRSRSPFERQRRDISVEEERKKKRCRDYDEKGYCMKGDQCIYDHGPDPVVVDDIALEKIVGSGGKAGVGVPPITHNFSVPPPGYTPLNPPPPGVDNVYVTNSNAVHSVGLSEGYNPEAPALSAPSITAGPQLQPTSIDFSVPPPPFPSHLPPTGAWQNTYTVPSFSGSLIVHPPNVSYEPSQPSPALNALSVINPKSSSASTVEQFRRGRGGSVRHNTRIPAFNSNNRTLQVRKIPASLNNIAKLNEHFAQFGNIVNIQVCYDGDQEAALITYSTRLEAVAAIKSTTPILNNRFVKVFWHTDEQTTDVCRENRAFAANTNETDLVVTHRRPTIRNFHSASNIATEQKIYGAGNPHADRKALKNSTAYTNPNITKDEKHSEIRRKRKVDKEKENRMLMLDLQRRKSILLSKEVEQQKLVLQKMNQCADATTKRQLYKIFKKLDESIKTLKTDLEGIIAVSIKVEDDQVTNDANVNSDLLKQTSKKLELASNDVAATLPDAHHLSKKARILKSTQTVDNRSCIVAVSGFTSENENDIIVHMENFGELVDIDFPMEAHEQPNTAFFTYTNFEDAEKAIARGADCRICPLVVRSLSNTNHEFAISDRSDEAAEEISADIRLGPVSLEDEVKYLEKKLQESAYVHT